MHRNCFQTFKYYNAVNFVNCKLGESSLTSTYFINNIYIFELVNISLCFFIIYLLTKYRQNNAI